MTSSSVHLYWRLEVGSGGEKRKDFETLSTPGQESRDQLPGKTHMWVFFQERALQTDLKLQDLLIIETLA